MKWSTPFPLLLLALDFIGVLTANAQGVLPGTQVADVLYSTPSCARGCVLRELMAAQCPLLNVTALADCLCPNTALLATISTCVQQACNHAETIEALEPSEMLCSLYPQESRADDIRTTCIVSIVVGSLITAVRCFYHYYTRGDLGREDWTCVIATVFLLAASVNGLYLAKLGAGRHYWTEDPKNEVGLWMTFWIAQVFYAWMQYFTKLSILLLYLRIFGITRWMRVACNSCIAILTIHSIPLFLTSLFQCQPLEAIWNKYIEGHCLNVSTITYIGSAISIAWDVILIALPIPEILKLHVPARKRLTIIISLALASAAGVTTVIRLKYVILFNATHDPSWDNVPVGIWSIVEQLCFIICGSLPVLWQLLTHFASYIHVNWGITRNATVRAAAQPISSNAASFEPVQPLQWLRPISQRETSKGLCDTTYSTSGTQFDRTQRQSTWSCEELVDTLR